MIVFSIDSRSAASCRLLQVTPLFCLVTAVQGAHRQVHEELEASTPAVKILQDVFGEWTKATETKDEARTTEEAKSEWYLSSQYSARVLIGPWRYFVCGTAKTQKEK